MTVRTTVSCAFLFATLIVAIVLGTTLWGGSGASAGAGGQTQTITICKVTSPSGGVGFPFNWSNSFGAQPGFSLNDGECNPIGITDPFNQFTEVVPSGWTLTNIACTHTSSVVFIYDAAGSHPHNQTFDPGDDTAAWDQTEANVTCTFTNTCPPVISCAPSPTPTCLPGTICTPTPSPTPSPSPIPSPTRTEAPTPTPTKAPTPTPPPPCSITINKQTDPAGGTGFGFSSGWAGLQGITLDDGQSITKPVPCGPIFNVYETPMPGWVLTNIACVITGGAGNFSIIGASPNPAFQPGDTEVNFDSLTPGANLSCTFTNVQRATPRPVCSITINKKTNPAGGTGFAFSSAFAGLQGISLNGGQSITKPVPCDHNLNVYEMPKPGWTLTNIVCGFTSGAGNFSIVGANANPAFQPGDNEVDFNSLTPGANVTCTFINTQTDGRCSITINKGTSPAGGTGFSFSSAWAGLQGITLDDQGSITKPVGCGPIFNVYEMPKPGWTLTNIACAITGGTGNFRVIGANPNPAFQAGDNEVSFDSLSTGANLVCAFGNTQTDGPCTITITKQTDPAGGTGFSFIAPWTTQVIITLDGGQSITIPVPCDTVSSVEETPKPGWVLTNIACVVTGGAGNFSIIAANTSPDPAFQPGDNVVLFDSLTPGANLSCTFTNERATESGTITICKNTDPPGGTGFSFGWSAPLIRTRPFPLGGGHCVTFPGLLPGDGPYSFWELSPLPSGWMLTNIVCTGGANVLIGSNNVFDPGDAGVTIDLGPGENVTCTFTNTQREQPAPCTKDTPGYTVIKDISTGQGGAPAAADPNWARIAPAGAVYSTAPATPFWSPAPAGTNWINHVPAISVVYVPNGTYVYDTSFYVDTNNYYGFELNFKWAADDNVNIVLNASTVASGGSWSLIGPAIVNTFAPLIANATNYLKATLDNIPIGRSPTGLLVVGQLTACRKPPVKPACITIVKDALPDDPQDFNFTWNSSSFILDDDATLPNPSATPNSKTLCDLSPGATHTITEAPIPSPWILANITCSQSPPAWATVVIGPNPPATFNLGDNAVQITLPALLPSGGHVTCIFSDRKIDRPGCITIIKDRRPNSPEDYLFQGAPWPGLFTLDDDPSSATPNSATLCDLTANGTYTITELGAVPPPPPQQQVYPTAVVNIVCTVSPATFATVVFLPSGSTSYQPGDNGVKITVGPQTANGNVTCIFVNAPNFPSLLGDLTCNGTVDTMDMLKGLKYLAGLNMPAMDSTSEGACPWIGSTVLDVADEQMLWGDENCDGMVDTMDTLMELQALAGLPYTTGEFSSAEVQGRQLR